MRLFILLLFTLFFGTSSCATCMVTPDTTCNISIKERTSVPEPEPTMVPLNYKDYSDLLNKVKRKLNKQQWLYSQTSKGQYYFEIYPVSMFPFFCLDKKDTVDADKYHIVFSEDCETNIGVFLDRFSMDHIQIAVLQYIKVGSLKPYCRTYMLFSFRKNFATKEWESERTPFTVTMVYNARTGYYFSK